MLREIACDESGYEGEKLVGGETDVFAHAGVHLTPSAAAACIADLRRRIRSPALEYKANHLLREKHRPVLDRFLGPAGPVHGRARVHLVDKAFLLVHALVGVLGDGVPEHRVDALARIVYRATRSRSDGGAAVLSSGNDLLRTRTREGVRAHVDAVTRAVDDLGADTTGEAGVVLALLRPVRQRADALAARLLDPRRPGPALDPLFPAVARAVRYWSDGGRVAVSLIHDRQTTLTEERIARIVRLCGEPGGRPVQVRLVGSRADPRVQIADFLAGVLRTVASHELAGRGDADLAALVRPYVDPASIWADERSWTRLAPPAGTPATVTVERPDRGGTAARER